MKESKYSWNLQILMQNGATSASKFDLTHNTTQKIVSNYLTFYSAIINFFKYSFRYDYVAVRDGPDENSPLVGGQPWTGGDWCDESCNGDKYCGYNKPPVVISTGNALHIQFGSDLSGGRMGFRAVITKGMLINIY